MLTPRAFWFLRHGETDWNARNLSQGNVDIPLNEVGRAQAHTAAGLLRTRGIRSVVASPLSRAHDTALAVAGTIGRDVAVDEELREVSFGVQEGQPMSDWFHDWVAGASTPEGAESFAALRARAVRAVNRAGARMPGPGRGPRRPVPRPAGRDGAGAERPHAQRGPVFLRAFDSAGWGLDPDTGGIAGRLGSPLLKGTPGRPGTVSAGFPLPALK